MGLYIKIHSKDNVVIALEDYQKGDQLQIEDLSVYLKEDVARGHKIAIYRIEKDDNIIKYGFPIGHASQTIEAGQHVHVHNVITNLSDVIEYSYAPELDVATTKLASKKVQIYKRKNGDIGIRNELWIVPTVGCVNGIAEAIIRTFKEENDTSLIDGVFVFGHPYGCSQMGDDHDNTKLTLQNITKHPNAGGVLVLGLGCENNQVDAFRNTLGAYDEERVKFLITQEVEDEIESGVAMLKALYDQMVNDQRVEGHISDLNIGLECGGSDGLSGITANPLLGLFSDYMISHGGTTVLTEVPEMFGAETLLMNRCINKEVYEKTVEMVNGFKKYYKDHGQVIYDNPSPGNKKGGITTLEDKSLGCTRKSGDSPVVDVLKHGEILKTKGLNLLSAPGNDLVATTSLGMSGCQLVLFTTGRGTPFGGFIPTMKISTNSEIATKKQRWIDFDAGRLVHGISMEQLLEEFVDYVIDVVNGTYVNNEKNQIREIAIFKSGVTL
jgi:altronate hydrolase